jgi:hypothetical protein
MRAALSSSAARTRPMVQPNWRQTSRSLSPATRGDNLAAEVTHRREPPHWSRAGVPRVRGVE